MWNGCTVTNPCDVLGWCAKAAPPPLLLPPPPLGLASHCGVGRPSEEGWWGTWLFRSTGLCDKSPARQKSQPTPHQPTQSRQADTTVVHSAQHHLKKNNTHTKPVNESWSRLVFSHTIITVPVKVKFSVFSWDHDSQLYYADVIPWYLASNVHDRNPQSWTPLLTWWGSLMRMDPIASASPWVRTGNIIQRERCCSIESRHAKQWISGRWGEGPCSQWTEAS